MPATIVDIKEQTGLSLATISKYLNGGNVLPENKVKIEAAIKDLHYEVNEIARGLVTNKTKTIGVIVYRIESLFNGTLLRYIGDSLRKNGYGLLICDSCNDEEIEAQNVRFLMGKKVDGMIIVPVARNSNFLKPAKQANIPIVLMDRSFNDVELDCVKINNRLAAYRAVNILIANNHKKIAVISSDESVYTGYERYLGYTDAMKEAGYEISKTYVKKGTHAIEYGYQSMKSLLALKDRPTAVFMSNYEITLGAVMAVNEMGVLCPEEISMIGFDDLILSHVVKPKMFMVVQPMKEMSERAVDILLKRINSKEASLPMEVVMSTIVQEGNSITKI